MWENKRSLVGTVTKIRHLEAHGGGVIGIWKDCLVVIRDKIEVIVWVKFGDVRRSREWFGTVVDHPSSHIGIERRRDLVKQTLIAYQRRPAAAR